MTYNPTPKSGYLPVVITNASGLADTSVYVLFEGNYKIAGGDLFFFDLKDSTSPPMGVYSPVTPTEESFSVNYSYPLSSLPKSSTGANDYLVYVPSCPSNRFYFSLNSPMFLQSDASPNNIAAPTYYAFYDPNYCNLFESIELSFLPTGGSGGDDIEWTASINTTEVDAFSVPMRIQYQSYDPVNPSAKTQLLQNPNALPSGFGTGGAPGNITRSQILTSILSSLTNGDLTGQTPKIWPKLAIPFYSNPYLGTGFQTYLRVLSPKQSVGDGASPPNIGGLTDQHLPSVQPGPVQYLNYNYPPFPIDYVQSTSYGNTSTYSDNLFSHYTSGTSLFISTGGGSPTIYEGVASGSSPNQVLTFSGISGPNTGQISTLNQGDLNTFDIMSGSQLMSGGVDGDLLGFYFGDAFTVGFLASAVGTANSGPPPNDPINITDALEWEPFYTPLYYTAQYTLDGGPWFDLYAKSMHEVAVRNSVSGTLNDVGLCYGYDFDDSLGISGTITPSNLTDRELFPYASITIGLIDTPIPNPYTDPTEYNVTFEFPLTASLEYAQGMGSFIPVTSGSTIHGLISNRANPLRLHYTNGQGPTGDHFFNVYLLYQFIQPTEVYNGSTLSIINATTITPNATTPSSFIINLLP